MYSVWFAISMLMGCVAVGGEVATNAIRVVCLGDSLTACGGEGGHYTDWLADWLPECDIINKGIGGDTLSGGRARFERDVLALKPAILVLALGANDFWKQRSVSLMEEDLQAMVSAARSNGVEVVIASCFGDRSFELEKNVEFHDEYFGYAEQIGLMEYRMAKAYDCVYVPNMQVDIKPNGKAPYWGDSHHPNRQGNEWVAKRIRDALNIALERVRNRRGSQE